MWTSSKILGRLGCLGLLGLLVILSGCSKELPTKDVSIVTCATAPEGRAGAAYAAAGNTVYVIGGRSEEHDATSTMLCYDAVSDKWTTVTTPLAARVHPTAVTLKGEIYVGLGYGAKGIYKEESYLNDFYRFEPATNTWTRLADYPSGKTVAAVSFSDGQYIYVGFGFRGFTHELYRYDPDADDWKELCSNLKASDFPPRVMSPVAGSVGNRYFVGTGLSTYHPVTVGKSALLCPVKADIMQLVQLLRTDSLCLVDGITATR